jgi:hypothetical protein
MEPTIAEETIARQIAFWHGSKVLFYKSGEGAKTVAATRGFDSGWSWETDRYVDRHWREYVPAAKSIIESR